MAQVHPTSLALLSVLAATSLVIAIHLAVEAVRRRVEARRWQSSDDIVIDLTFVQAAIEHDQQVARRIGAERK